jgi:hypothetical protein
MLANLLPSLIRTVVPWIVAFAGPALLQWGGVSEAQLTTGATVVVGAVYYALVRVLEQYVPQLGWLLGYAAAPSYANAKTIPGEVVGDANGGSGV